MELTDFRQDAVATGLAMLARHNGCCIADVVGLGKTCIGVEIRRRLAIKSPQAGDPLVVCPSRRAAMRERICDRFGPDNAAVVGMSRLTAANYAADRARRKTLRGIAGDLRHYFPDAAVDEQTGEALRHLLLLRRRQDIVRHCPDSKLNGRLAAFLTTQLLNQQCSLEHAYRKAGGRRQIVSRLRKRRPAATAPAATSRQRRGTNRNAA